MFSKLGAALIVGWIIGAFISLGLVGAVIYVGVHFLLKVW